MKKVRADKLLASQHKGISREKAKRLIMAGSVYMDKQKIYKPGEMLNPDSKLEYEQDESIYVSRGGEKLAKAIKEFNLDLSDKVCIDIGASTGGFTDCMLKNGARKVYAVDVGYGQIDWKLRSDNRVIVMERENARYLRKEQFEDEITFGSMDVSFISTSLILPALSDIMTTEAELVVLIKPQFEAGRELVGKKGIIKDPHIHEKVILDVINSWVELDWRVLGLSYSPITGAKGNIEYLAYITKNPSKESLEKDIIAEIVNSAHNELL